MKMSFKAIIALIINLALCLIIMRSMALVL